MYNHCVSGSSVNSLLTVSLRNTMNFYSLPSLWPQTVEDRLPVESNKGLDSLHGELVSPFTGEATTELATRHHRVLIQLIYWLHNITGHWYNRTGHMTSQGTDETEWPHHITGHWCNQVCHMAHDMTGHYYNWTGYMTDITGYWYNIIQVRW